MELKTLKEFNGWSCGYHDGSLCPHNCGEKILEGTEYEQIVLCKKCFRKTEPIEVQKR